MAKDLAAHIRSILVSCDTHTNRITAVFGFHDLPWGTDMARSSSYSQFLLIALWKSRYKLCLPRFLVSKEE